MNLLRIDFVFINNWLRRQERFYYAFTYDLQWIDYVFKKDLLCMY